MLGWRLCGWELIPATVATYTVRPRARGLSEPCPGRYTAVANKMYTSVNLHSRYNFRCITTLSVIPALQGLTSSTFSNEAAGKTLT